MPAIQLSETANSVIRHLVSARDNDDYNRVRNKARAIGGGVIAAIVVIIVLTLAAIIFAIVKCSRNKRRRAQNELEMKKYVGGVPVTDATAAGNTNGPAPSGGNMNGYGLSGGYVANDGIVGNSKSEHNASDAMPPAYTANNGPATAN
ncbi:hypothetical protein BDP55DRAFT_733855 [Colletotrichum godetiae]|uniref:Uncharacterized protein n=1 Tax=Colletotrichum godetiae TaxID=1209918 RepID=A0AAJ0A904_9PEZI|nr:uncharacterized protein BDP55DRAFT_733855 [Colletotrichum godetiae]KAK1658749.1 hypothetical protein BDP55DRAFT_733855 [Colletotrichum godetiae]